MQASSRTRAPNRPFALTSEASLPYKPRDLECRRPRQIEVFGALRLALTPRCTTGSTASAARGGQRRTTREADLSTEQAGAQAPSRFSRPHGDHGRPQGRRRPPRARSQAAQRLTSAASRARRAMERLRQRADFLAAATGAKAADGGFRAAGAQARRRWTGPRRLHRLQEGRQRGRAQPRAPAAAGIVRLSAAGRMRPGHDYVLIGRRAALELPFDRWSRTSAARCGGCMRAAKRHARRPAVDASAQQYEPMR